MVLGKGNSRKFSGEGGRCQNSSGGLVTGDFQDVFL